MTMQKKIIVTAGPTRENIDPIRYLSNRSSGKTGYEIAKEFASRGARVRLISGPVCIDPPSNTELTKVESSEQMQKAVLNNYDWADIVIMAAAVADFRPRQTAESKIKKTDAKTLEFEKTPDILARLGKSKKHQILIGFALETENLANNAQQKLVEKNLDVVIGNSEQAIDSEKADFILIDKKGSQEFKDLTKERLAIELANRIL